MKKQSILFYLFLISNLYCFSQVKITLGESFEEDNDNRIVVRISSNTEQLIVEHNYKEKEVILKKLNFETLTLSSVKSHKDFPENFTIERTIECADRVYLLYSLKDKVSKLITIYCREIDFKKGEFVGKEKLFFQFEEEIISKSFKVSKSKQTLFLKYSAKPKIRNDNKNHEVIGFHVCDQSLNILWSKKVEMPYTEKKMDILDYALNSKGDVSILTTIYEDNTKDYKREEDGLPNYHLELLMIDSSELKVSKLPLGYKYFRSIWLTEGPSEYLTCAGFFNLGFNTTDADSIFLFKINPQGKVSDFASYEIPLKIMNMFADEKTQYKNTKKEADGIYEVKNMSLQEIHFDKTGGAILIGEQNYVDVIVTGDKYKSYKYEYYNENLLISRFDSVGKLKWMQKIPKNQLNVDISRTTFQYISTDITHYLIFPDNRQNLNLPLNLKPSRIKNEKKAILNAYKIDDISGKYSQILIIDPDNINGNSIHELYTGSLVQTKKNEFIMHVKINRNEWALLKVLLPD